MRTRGRIQYSGDPVRSAVWLYYAEGHTQEEVASILGASRQTIAKYLKMGQSRGLVSTKLDPDLLQEQELAIRVRERYMLGGVHVTPSYRNDEKLRQCVGNAGSFVLSSTLRDGDMLGVSSGRTVGTLARSMPRARLTRATVIEVAGSSMFAGFNTPEACAAELAGHITARCLALYSPAYLTSASLADQLALEPTISGHFELMEQCRLLVFGIGELTPKTALDQPPFLNHTIRDHYLAAGARAIVFGRFVNATGNEVPGPLHDRTMAISLDVARKIPFRLAVCGGIIKRDSVRAAAAANLMTHLVVDTSLAQALLD